MQIILPQVNRGAQISGAYFKQGYSKVFRGDYLPSLNLVSNGGNHLGYLPLYQMLISCLLVIDTRRIYCVPALQIQHCPSLLRPIAAVFSLISVNPNTEMVSRNVSVLTKKKVPQMSFKYLKSALETVLMCSQNNNYYILCSCHSHEPRQGRLSN